jgi:predicted TIM-barrel fold metal-dependent hydrolase
MKNTEYDIVDVHTHLGESFAVPAQGGIDGLLMRMDFNGIACAVLSPIPGQEDPEGIVSVRGINNAIAAAHRAHPDRIVKMLGAVEPRHGAPGLDEVDRVMEMGFSGLSFHNDFQGFPADHPNMFAIMERLARYPGAIVQMHTAIHSWLEAPFQAGLLAEAFPSITFINAHSLMDPTQTAYTLQQAPRLGNMVFDTCIAQKYAFPIEQVVFRLGDDRFMFGSNNPYYRDRTLDIDLIVEADIPEESKRKILGGNARRIFGIGPA